MKDDVKIFAGEIAIGDARYAMEFPARSWTEAAGMAEKIGAVIVGEDVLVIPGSGARGIVEFIDDNLVLCPVAWKGNAIEQLDAFMMLGEPMLPRNTEEQ